MKGQSTGSTPHVSATNKFQATFYCPLKKKSLHLGFFDLKVDAEKEVRKYVFDYYSKNTALLPKGISVAREDQTFVYTIWFGRKSKAFFRSKNLKEVIDARLEIITSLI